MKIKLNPLRGRALAALDRFVEQAGLGSRSAGIQQAISRLRHPQLEVAYATVWRSGPLPAKRTCGVSCRRMGSPMRRGEIVPVDLDPVRGE